MEQVLTLQDNRFIGRTTLCNMSIEASAEDSVVSLVRKLEGVGMI